MTVGEFYETVAKRAGTGRYHTVEVRIMSPPIGADAPSIEWRAYIDKLGGWYGPSPEAVLIQVPTVPEIGALQQERK